MPATFYAARTGYALRAYAVQFIATLCCVPCICASLAALRRLRAFGCALLRRCAAARASASAGRRHLPTVMLIPALGSLARTRLRCCCNLCVLRARRDSPSGVPHRRPSLLCVTGGNAVCDVRASCHFADAARTVYAWRRMKNALFAFLFSLDLLVRRARLVHDVVFEKTLPPARHAVATRGGGTLSAIDARAGLPDLLFAVLLRACARIGRFALTHMYFIFTWNDAATRETLHGVTTRMAGVRGDVAALDYLRCYVGLSFGSLPLPVSAAAFLRCLYSRRRAAQARRRSIQLLPDSRLPRMLLLRTSACFYSGFSWFFCPLPLLTHASLIQFCSPPYQPHSLYTLSLSLSNLYHLCLPYVWAW